MQSFAVCSDNKVGKKTDTEDISVHDLAFPATTDANKLANQVKAFLGKKDITCWRRLNLDSACRSNFDRGLIASF